MSGRRDQWHRAAYGIYVRGEHVIRRSTNPTSLRVWYVTGGPLAYRIGCGGGFFRLSDAKRAISDACHEVES